MSFVSVTRLRLRHWRFVPVFFWHTIPAFRQARKAPGNLSADVLNDANRTYWTRSVWADEAAMRAYMTSGAHMKAMPHLMRWCDEAATAHWTQPDGAAPDWREAHRRLVAEGRRSKVLHPSADHQAYRIPPPRS